MKNIIQILEKIKTQLTLKLILICGIFSFIIYVFFQGLEKDPTLIPSNFISKKFPEFTVKPLNGFSVFTKNDLSDSNQKIKIVNFFASWCPPCRIEHPQLIELSKVTSLYGIAKKDKKTKLIDWLQKHGNPFEKIGLDNDGFVSINWGVYGIPETFVIDKNGIIKYRHVGPILENDLPKIKKIINGLE